MKCKFSTFCPVFLSLFIVFSSLSLRAETTYLPPADPTDYRLDLITIVPSDVDVFSLWGHTALRIYSPENPSMDLWFDYGHFVFDRIFLYRFLRGIPDFYVAAAMFDKNLSFYFKTKRRIYSQQIYASNAEIKTILDILLVAQLPENRNYAYEHFTNNCTTQIRDILNTHLLENQLYVKNVKKNEGRTFRKSSMEPLIPSFYARYLIKGVLGKYTDAPISEWDHMFLPMGLMNGLEQLRKTQGKTSKIAPITLLTENENTHGNIIINHAGNMNDWYLGLFMFFVTLLVLYGGIFARILSWISPKQIAKYTFLFKGRAYRYYNNFLWTTSLMLMGIFGTVIYLLSFFTNHYTTFTNTNVFFFTPFLFLFLLLRLFLTLLKEKLKLPTIQYVNFLLYGHLLFAFSSLAGFLFIIYWGQFSHLHYGLLSLAIHCVWTTHFYLYKRELLN